MIGTVRLWRNESGDLRVRILHDNALMTDHSYADFVALVQAAEAAQAEAAIQAYKLRAALGVVNAQIAEEEAGQGVDR